ncbi:DUF397 domain-containing protein [Nocardia sp. NPDC056000]|uniref:DUF397 domain-containing protein n=1 Tax=Nocardia sp. NPDC056000 TaxID=3345674 RepID=UPI0035DA5D3A
MPVRGEWYKSSWSDANNQCVEICHDEGRTGVRDSKNPGGPELYFTSDQWSKFVQFVSE